MTADQPSRGAHAAAPPGEAGAATVTPGGARASAGAAGGPARAIAAPPGGPPAPPSPAEVADAKQWDATVRASLPTIRAAADKWRAGLAGFVSLALGGLFLKGPDTIAGLPTHWRVALTVLFAGGLLLALAGLWLAQRAAAGSPAAVTLVAVQRDYGSVDQFDVAVADYAAGQLTWARRAVALALALFVAGIVAWWWAPQPPAQAAGTGVIVPASDVCRTTASPASSITVCRPARP